MRSSREEIPPHQAPPQQSFIRRDAMDGSPSDLPPPQLLQPQHHQHQLSSETPPIDGAHIFALFYSLIFSIVHAVLTMVFTPVLGNSSNGRNHTPAAVRRESSRRSLLPPRESDGSIMGESDDPELAMVDIKSGGDGSSYHQPILKSQSLTSSSRSGRNGGGSGNGMLSSVDENEVVRFPGQGRIRPPLGRIERLPSISSISSGGSSLSNSSSSTSSSTSSSRSGGRRERSRPISQQLQPTTTSSRNFRRSGPVPRTSSPFSRITSPRMTHSTYFLE